MHEKHDQQCVGKPPPCSISISRTDEMHGRRFASQGVARQVTLSGASVCVKYNILQIVQEIASSNDNMLLCRHTFGHVIVPLLSRCSHISSAFVLGRQGVSRLSPI